MVIKEAEKLLSSLVSAADTDELFDQNKDIIAVENDGENSQKNKNKKGKTVESNKSAKLVRKAVKTFYYTTARTIALTALQKDRTTTNKIETEEDVSITSPSSTNVNIAATTEKSEATTTRLQEEPKSSSEPSDGVLPTDSILDLVSLRSGEEESVPSLVELANARNLLGTALKDANPENLKILLNLPQ